MWGNESVCDPWEALDRRRDRKHNTTGHLERKIDGTICTVDFSLEVASCVVFSVSAPI